MAHYVFQSEWRLDAPVDQVWNTLLLAAEWPSWWRGIQSVERLADGDESGTGMRLRQRWRSLLPYTLTIDLEIDRVDRYRLLVGRASGDLVGSCTWVFEPHGEATVVRFCMDVHPGPAWMNLPVPFAGRVAAANYMAIMAWGGDGLARRLARGESPLVETAIT